jgi:hypothetical protein
LYSLTVRFVLAKDADWSKIPERALDRAEKLYRNIPGLVSKAFVYEPGNREYGGNYVWETREQLDNFLKSDVWQQAKKMFGEPKIVQIHRVAAYVEHGRIRPVTT